MAEEVVQRLRALTRAPSLALTSRLTTNVTPVPRTLIWPPPAPGIHVVHMHAYMENSQSPSKRYMGVSYFYKK